MLHFHSPLTLPSIPSMRRAPVGALACLLLFCACLFALPTPAPAAPVSDPAVQGAKAQVRARAADLLKSGKAEEAYGIYKSLLLNNPDDDEAVLGLARAGAVSKHWNQSVTAYEMLLEKYPNTAALHGELARLYMLLGEREAAERSLAEAKRLGGGTELNLDAMEKKYSQVQIHGRLRAGLLYDSNVNMGPDTEGMELGSWHITVPGVRTRTASGATSALTWISAGSP